jgi:DNA-binding IclR family transcriptional regulator
MEQANEARSVGFALECGDVVEGIHAIAAPVLASDGTLDRVISVYALATALPEKRMRQTAQALANLANAISRRSP